MAQSYKNVRVALPGGYSIVAEFPSSLDEKLMEVGLRALLGGAVAVSKSNSDDTRREFLIRYIASIVNDADSAAKSTQMSNKMKQSKSDRIIEDLLKSLHEEKE